MSDIDGAATGSFGNHIRVHSIEGGSDLPLSYNSFHAEKLSTPFHVFREYTLPLFSKNNCAPLAIFVVFVNKVNSTPTPLPLFG